MVSRRCPPGRALTPARCRRTWLTWFTARTGSPGSARFHGHRSWLWITSCNRPEPDELQSLPASDPGTKGTAGLARSPGKDLERGRPLEKCTACLPWHRQFLRPTAPPHLRKPSDLHGRDQVPHDESDWGQVVASSWNADSRGTQPCRTLSAAHHPSTISAKHSSPLGITAP